MTMTCGCCGSRLEPLNAADAASGETWSHPVADCPWSEYEGLTTAQIASIGKLRDVHASPRDESVKVIHLQKTSLAPTDNPNVVTGYVRACDNLHVSLPFASTLSDQPVDINCEHCLRIMSGLKTHSRLA